jgi:hypothetical protein
MALSPPKYPGKKRPLEFVSLNQANGSSNVAISSFTESSSSPWLDSHKRSRISQPMNDENSSPSRLDGTRSHEADVFKRYDPSMFAASSASYASHPMHHGEQGTAINLMREDYERKLQHKDEQLVNLTKISKQVYESHARLEQENKSLAEENKILKKAFGIQDNRMRELTSQNQQYQHLIEQMSDYLANMERMNYQLREELRQRDLQASGGNHTFLQPPNPPPDVF